jgi:hypothetical protein
MNNLIEFCALVLSVLLPLTLNTRSVYVLGMEEKVTLDASEFNTLLDISV